MAACFHSPSGRERDEDVALVPAHRIGGHFGPAGAGPNVIDLVGEFGQQQFFDLRAVADRLIERNVGQSLRGDHQRMFAEPWDEFGPQAAGHHARGGQHHQRPARRPGGDCASVHVRAGR